MEYLNQPFRDQMTSTPLCKWVCICKSKLCVIFGTSS